MTQNPVQSEPVERAPAEAPARDAAPPPRPRTRRSEEVYWTLRREITAGVLRPNAALVEDEIAARLGVSRTPVRESMQRLEADGLIDSHRRRWIVHEHTQDEIVQLYEVRCGLESHAARLAGRRATPEQLEVIEGWRPRMTAHDPTVLNDRARNNDSFHDAINAASGNLRLLAAIQANRLFHFNTRLAALYSPDELARSSRQHDELITAVCARDAERAATTAREHVEFSLELILRKLF
ncbi:GntR family transcriptional regulator [Streptomyces malaysiensis]|uniref:GntR family transcriptional regulator n=1 Tax=Streptomyces malaysiensis TaxID=92644 RepID=UPI0032204B9B|nr:GntR family transcriptional regulator [Streptomyces malaysiensis]